MTEEEPYYLIRRMEGGALIVYSSNKKLARITKDGIEWLENIRDKHNRQAIREWAYKFWAKDV